jgi:hypothetical protein
MITSLLTTKMDIQTGMRSSPKKERNKKEVTIRSLSAKGSIKLPNLVTLFEILATNPSTASVITEKQKITKAKFL